MNNKKSLADKISVLLNAAPNCTPDEENNAESGAKVVEYEDDQETEPDDTTLSSYRKQNISLLDESDERYAGKKSSRKSYDDSDDDLQPEYIDQETDSSYESEETSENDERIEDDANDVTINEKTGNFRHMNETNPIIANKKSVSVQNQIRIWESLLEMRIQLQKCIVISNKLPEPAVYTKMKADKEFDEKTDSLKTTLTSTLGNMLELQQLLIKKFPESKNVLSNATKRKLAVEKKENNEDEEIPSNTDPEDEDDADEESGEDNKPAAKKKKLSSNEIEVQIKNIHSSYKNFRNVTIQKWNEKTEILLGKNANVNSVLNQIEHNLNDKGRLVKRTQLKRSLYHILGSTQPIVNEEEDNIATHEYNNNIFDDDDFYHQLLRELIEVKSADITDPIQLSRQWIQLQNLRSKMKRKIDTRATKGRKIRYGIHTKLVNFMAPIVNERITDEAQTELFSSLFGNKTY